MYPTKTNPEKTGAYISNLRRKNNMTQFELAMELKVSHQAVSKWETGSALPDIDILLSMANIFSVSIESLILGNDEEIKTNPDNKIVFSEPIINKKTELSYRIEVKEELNFIGILREFTSDNCGAIWDEFFDSENNFNQKIRDEFKLYRPPFWQIGIYFNRFNKKDGKSELFIGAESDGRKFKGFDTLYIPATTWAVFKTKGHVQQLGELWLRVKTEWLPTSGYVYDNSIYTEIYPMNMMWNDPNYEPEIWIPVIKT
jgi:predicted transcriptional regulator YdeE/DNA-binding XRE family transcriptional regulator